MSNSLSLFGGGKIAIPQAKAMANALKNAAVVGASNQLPDGGVYINFSGKMGKYSIGPDAEDADPNELWLVNVYAFEAGYVCWKGGQPVAKRLRSIYEEPVAAPDPMEHGPFNPNLGEGWFNAKAMVMRSLDRGIQGYFGTNTKTALMQFSTVEAAVAERMDKQAPCFPVLLLKKEQFVAHGQKNWKPVLEIYGWLGIRQINALGEMAPEDVSAAVDDLIAQAADDFESGILDTTMMDPDHGMEADDEESGIPDAEVIAGEDAADNQTPEAQEPPAAPSRPTAARSAAAPAAAATRRPAAATPAAPAAPPRRRPL